MEKEHRYKFVGAVYVFDTLRTRDYIGYTSAVSESKARNNIAARYKFEYGWKMNVPIRLDGELERLPEAALNFVETQLSMF